MSVVLLLLPAGEGRGEGQRRAEEPSAKYLTHVEPEIVRHFDLLAASRGGIPKLREFILTLAVQGKLVPQDPGDEPAVVLLKKMQLQKSRLIATGDVRREKGLAEISLEDQTFHLPFGWQWVRLGDLGYWGAGATPLRSNSSYFGGTIPWFKSGELTADTISESEESVTELALRDCSLRLNKIGDVLVAMYGATIGKTAILNVAGTTNQAVCACTPYAGLQNTYLLLLLKALKPYFISIGVGGAQPNISREKLIAATVGLPPVAEQSRIVTRVEELMRLCDALDAKGRLEAAQHAQLVSTLLGTLTESETPEALSANWHRVATHFDLLLDRPEAVDALEQAILQLAVRGLLVPQNPADEPASVLLQQIRAEKDRLIAQGKIKRDKPLPPVAEDENPSELPQGWEWVRLGALTDLISGQHLGPTEYVEGLSEAIPYLTGPAEFGATSPDPTRSTGERRAVAKQDDILITVKGSGVGKLNLVIQPEIAISRQLMAIRPIGATHPFLLLLLQTMAAKFQAQSVGIAIPGIGRDDVTFTLLGLPPLAEQSRIVARVDSLRRLCADLRQRLSASQTTQTHLAEVLVEQPT